MNFWRDGILAFITLSLMVFSCTKSTSIGGDLLDEDLIEVDIIDSSTVNMSTILGDSLITYTYGEYLTRYFIGNIQDPIFGNTTTELCAQVTYDATLGTPDFADATLDSIVLVLALDTAYQYLNIEDMTLDIHRVEDDIIADTVHYANETINYNNMALASHSFTRTGYLQPKAIVRYDASGDAVNDTLLHIRITLPNSLGQEFLDADYSDYSTASKTLDFFKGFYIKAGNGTDGIIPIRFSTNDLITTAGAHIYYKDIEGKTLDYRFPFGSVGARIPLYNNDHSGSMVETALQSTDMDSDLAFIQGTEGTFAKVTFPHIKALDGIIVNKAELTFSIIETAGDDIDKYSPTPQIILAYKNEESNYLPIDDVYLSGTNLTNTFGGAFEDGNTTYTMNISKHIQKMIDGDSSNEIYILTNRRKETPQRVVLGGGQNTMAPSLKIYYSK